jgi:hypothetical protein
LSRDLARSGSNTLNAVCQQAWASQGLTTASQPIAGQATLLHNSAYGIAKKAQRCSVGTDDGDPTGNGGLEVCSGFEPQEHAAFSFSLQRAA